MPSVGSTPTTSSPALHQQQPLPQPQPQPQAQLPAAAKSQQSSQHSNNNTNNNNNSNSTSSSSNNNNNANTNTNNNTTNAYTKKAKKSSSTSSSSTSSSLTMAQQQKHHIKLKQQHSLPLQLQYHHYQPQVTTTQPSPAGTFINQAGIIIPSPTPISTSTTTTTTKTANASALAAKKPIGIRTANSGSDITPLSTRSNSFSSIDTNQTLLNTIIHQQQSHQQTVQQQRKNTNRSFRTKYGQFMIITPAVSIDRDFEYETAFDGNVFDDDDDDDDVGDGNHDASVGNDAQDPYFNNGNIFRMAMRQGSVDSGNSSDSSLHSTYNPYLHTSRQHLLPKNPTNFYTFSSWRWCTLICAAMRCFGAGHNSHAPYSTSFVRRPYYQRTNSTGIHYTSSSMPHHRLRSSSFTPETAFEHFSAPFKPRKTRDHMNNITYEL